MFYYVFSLTGSWTDADDLRIIENRKEAWMYLKILKLPLKVLAK